MTVVLKKSDLYLQGVYPKINLNNEEATELVQTARKKEDSFVKIEVQLEILNNDSNTINIIINRLCVEPGIIATEYNKVTNYIDDDDDDYEEKQLIIFITRAHINKKRLTQISIGDTINLNLKRKEWEK